MDMTPEEYFFYEWLILSKEMTSEEFAKMTEEEIKKLKLEFHSKYQV